MDKKQWYKILGKPLKEINSAKDMITEANLKIDENTHRILLLVLDFYKKKGNKNDISDSELNFVIDQLRKIKSI